MAITEQQVFEAANSLCSQDKKVTVAAIRETLGNGSNTTIVKFLQKWRKLNPEKGYDLKRFILPPEHIVQKFYELFTLIASWIEERMSSDYIQVLDKENEELKAELVGYKKLQTEFEAVKELQQKMLETIKQISQEKGGLEQKVKDLEETVKQK